jgi:hypothetical protein
MRKQIIYVTLAIVIPAAYRLEAKPAAQKLQGGGSFAATDSTNIDFTETMIDGKMQAPQGFFLQGKKAQALTNMVKLRSKFRSELRNSKSAVKAITK